jgi:hypothetical protein
MARSALPQRRAGARGERGQLLVEVIVAIGVGATALLSLVALVAATARLDAQSRERALARRAAESRLAEIAALDRASFAAALAGGAAAAILSFDVPGLAPLEGRLCAGAVTVDPPAGDPAFPGATLFGIHVEVAWSAAAGPETLALDALVRPGTAAGGRP